MLAQSKSGKEALERSRNLTEKRGRFGGRGGSAVSYSCQHKPIMAQFIYG